MIEVVTAKKVQVEYVLTENLWFNNTEERYGLNSANVKNSILHHGVESARVISQKRRTSQDIYCSSCIASEIRTRLKSDTLPTLNKPLLEPPQDQIKFIVLDYVQAILHVFG